jgi:MarR family
MASWGFLTNHARALLCIAHDPGMRLRDVAARLDITERSAHAIITDLTAAGYLVKQKDGRRNRYQIQAHLPLPEPASRERTVGEVLALLTGNDRPGIELPPASEADGRRATQAELKTPLMPGRHADGAGSALPDPGAESPDAARAGDPAR